jgi:hypothetical protein
MIHQPECSEFSNKFEKEVTLHLSLRKSQCDLLAQSTGHSGVGYVRDHLANLSYLSTCHISSPLHSPTYSGQNPAIPDSPIGISGIAFIFFTMYFTLYRTILNGLVAHPGSGVTRI